MIVDQADRRSSPELLALLTMARDTGTGVVLLEGGTRPALTWRASDAFEQVAAARGTDPGPRPRWSPVPPDREVGAALGSQRAAGRLLAEWTRDHTNPGRSSDPPLLVGLGPAEAEGLNRAVRAWLADRGELAGPGVDVGGRAMQAGERVVALRRLGPDVPAGTLGRVDAIDPATRSVAVRWPAATGRLRGRAGAQIGYGYAVTAPLAARMEGPVLLLGAPADVPRLRSRVLTAAVAGPTPTRSAERTRPTVGLGL
jgi:hypothetical protein